MRPHRNINGLKYVISDFNSMLYYFCSLVIKNISNKRYKSLMATADSASFCHIQKRESSYMKVKSDHRSKFSNLSNWKEEA